MAWAAHGLGHASLSIQFDFTLSSAKQAHQPIICDSIASQYAELAKEIHIYSSSRAEVFEIDQYLD
jgi:hypothetical protein